MCGGSLSSTFNPLLSLSESQPQEEAQPPQHFQSSSEFKRS